MTSSTDSSASGSAVGGRNKLTKGTVVDRALKLADETGLDTLTIRRLAQDLGVTPMALYWHFRSKDELLEGLADRVMSGIGVAVDRSAPWPDQLRTMMESLVRVLREHPSAVPLLMRFQKQSEASLAVTEVALDVLRTAGFDPLQASEICRLGLWTCITLVMSDLEEPGLVTLSPEERAELQRKKQVGYAMLPEALYPRLVECAGSLAKSAGPDFHYDFGIRLFLAGVEAMAGTLRAGNPED